MHLFIQPWSICAASTRTHLELQAYWLTDANEINPLGIEIW